MQLVVLGKGDRKYEEFFHWAAQQYQGRMTVRLDYNEELSMAIYSGADLFLMPSKSEPCGLSQMIAMRYGTIPIVRETGGLKDTVQPYEAWRDSGNGFTFANYSSGDMLYVIREAVYLYKDYPDAFSRLRQKAMSCDFSWSRSAREYLRIYANITGKPWTPKEEVETAAETPVEESVTETVTEMPAEESVTETVTETPAEEPAAETVTETPAEELAAEAAAETPTEEPAAETAAETPAEEPAPETAVEEPAPEPVKKTAGRKTAARKTTTRKTAETSKSGSAAKKETKKKGAAAKKTKKDAAE